MRSFPRLLSNCITPPGAFFLFGFLSLALLITATGTGFYSDDLYIAPYLKGVLQKYALARFMFLGSADSIIPSLSMSSAGSRLLFFSSIGSSVVIALALLDFFSVAANSNRLKRWSRRSDDQ